MRRRDGRNPIIYGDVFNVSEDLASKPINPTDATAMQTAENIVLGHTKRDGPASVTQSAGMISERESPVSSRDVTDIIGIEGVTVSEAEEAGNQIITESIGGIVLGRFVELDVQAYTPGGAFDPDTVTIGEALEATALSAGDKPVEQSDASAIQAAEIRATGGTIPVDIAAVAQSVGTLNARTVPDECKTKLSDVLSLPADKAVTREDAERVIRAEVRNDPEMSTTPGGVAASMAAAARINENMSFLREKSCEVVEREIMRGGRERNV